MKKFVFSSTCATYGPPDRVPMTEDLPQRPINPYGESKLMFEKMLQWYQRTARAGVRRLPLLQRRRARAATSASITASRPHLIPNVLKVPLGQKPHCEIYGTDYPTPDGTCIRDYIHIVDLAQAHILALAPGKQGFYNLGNGDGYSVRQVIQMLREGHRQDDSGASRSRAVPAIRPRLVAAADKAIRELGWKPRLPQAGRHRHHRVGLAPTAPQRLPGLIAATRPLLSTRSPTPRDDLRFC